MLALTLHQIRARLADPFGFDHAFAGLSLAPEELPSLTREARLQGCGA